MVRRGLWQSTAGDALLLFALLLLLYLLNGGLIILADSVSNSYLPLSLLNEGNLSYTADEFPFLFRWELQGPAGVTNLAITTITPTVTALDAEGLLQPTRENYSLVPSAQPGIYVNTFGPGVGLTALPAVAVAQLLAGDLMDRCRLLAAVCRLVAAACVAGSAALLYLTARRFVTRGQSWALALAYGLGTCVWVVSSQSLTQHGPNELYLALGTYALARANGSWRWLAICGVAYSAAVVCRPTSGLVVLAVGVYLLITDWRGALAYAAACCPLLLFLAGYNQYYFDSPTTFGQTVQAKLYLEREFGSSNPWRTPFLRGFAGLLFSPSRGVLIFSPWLVLVPIGAVAVWRQPAYRWLRPLTIAAAAIAILQCKWFDWWGGWCYGYRPLVDTLPLAVPLVLPLLGLVWRSMGLRVLFGLLLGWSIFVQGLGAWVYDHDGWNARRGFAVVIPGRAEPYFTPSREAAESLAMYPGAQIQPAVLNIDLVAHNHRLWSWRDNQIGYYLTHFRAARQARHKAALERTWVVGHNPALTHYNLGVGLAQLGRLDESLAEYQLALRSKPDLAVAQLNLGNIYAQRRQFDLAAEAYTKTIEIEPRAPLPRLNLGNVLAEQGKFAEAAEQYRQSLALEPTSALSHFYLAESLAELGNDREAIDAYRESLRLAPGRGQVLSGLAWVLATSADASLRNPREAGALARQVVAATQSRDPRSLDAAAAAAAALGRFDEAISLAERAQALSATANEPALAAAIGARLELYRQQQPYLRSPPHVDRP